jgi:esterase/lipase superfamily enzyme
MPSIYAKNDNTLFFARANTELANILKQTSEEIYHSGSVVAQNDKYQAALKLDESLLLWKSQLSSAFDFENASLTEPETITKRKVVLKLRKFNWRYCFSTAHSAI